MTAPRWLDATETAAWRGLLGAHAYLVAALDGDLQAACGLGLADYDVLVTLSEAPGRRLRMRELAGAVYLSPSGVTRRVAALAARGLVAKEPCPDDRRGSYAVLTEAGARRLAEAAPDHLAHVRARFLDRLAPEQVAALAEALGPFRERPGQGEAGSEGGQVSGKAVRGRRAS